VRISVSWIADVGEKSERSERESLINCPHVKPGPPTGGVVRLRVNYQTPEALLGELTRGVGKGGIRIEAKRPLPVGTRFVFEMNAHGLKNPVEVYGTVLLVAPGVNGGHILHIRYEAPTLRKGLDGVLARIFDPHATETKRRDARVPFNIRAVERPDGPTFRVKNISRGGLGLTCDAETLPAHIRVGADLHFVLKLSAGMLNVRGTIVWTHATAKPPAPTGFGVKFTELKPKVAAYLEEMLALRALPAPPWIARIQIGPVD
jgi:hypothetical protein